MQEAGAAVSSLLADGKVVKSQACYLPLSPDGVPVIGRVPGAAGAFIAAGAAVAERLLHLMRRSGCKEMAQLLL